MEKDSAKESPRENQSEVMMVSGGSLTGYGDASVAKRPHKGDIWEQLTFTNTWVTILDRAIANVVVEEDKKNTL